MTELKKRMELPATRLQALRSGTLWRAWRPHLEGKKRKPLSQGDRRCGGPDMYDSLFGTAQRSLTLDDAGDRG